MYIISSPSVDRPTQLICILDFNIQTQKTQLGNLLNHPYLGHAVRLGEVQIAVGLLEDPLRRGRRVQDGQVPWVVRARRLARRVPVPATQISKSDCEKYSFGNMTRGVVVPAFGGRRRDRHPLALVDPDRVVSRHCVLVELAF